MSGDEARRIKDLLGVNKNGRDAPKDTQNRLFRSRILAGGEDAGKAKEEMVVFNRGLLYSLARTRRFQSYSRNYDELIDALKTALRMAVEDIREWDPERSSFAVYAGDVKLLEILRHLLPRLKAGGAALRNSVSLDEPLTVFKSKVRDNGTKKTLQDTRLISARALQEETAIYRHDKDKILKLFGEAVSTGAGLAGLSAKQTPKAIAMFGLKYGFPAGPEKALEEVGDFYGVTRERARQLVEPIRTFLRLWAASDFSGRYPSGTEVRKDIEARRSEKEMIEKEQERHKKQWEEFILNFKDHVRQKRFPQGRLYLDWRHLRKPYKAIYFNGCCGRLFIGPFREAGAYLEVDAERTTEEAWVLRLYSPENQFLADYAVAAESLLDRKYFVFAPVSFPGKRGNRFDLLSARSSKEWEDYFNGLAKKMPETSHPVRIGPSTSSNNHINFSGRRGSVRLQGYHIHPFHPRFSTIIGKEAVVTPVEAKLDGFIAEIRFKETGDLLGVNFLRPGLTESGRPHVHSMLIPDEREARKRVLSRTEKNHVLEIFEEAFTEDEKKNLVRTAGILKEEIARPMSADGPVSGDEEKRLAERKRRWILWRKREILRLALPSLEARGDSVHSGESVAGEWRRPGKRDYLNNPRQREKHRLLADYWTAGRLCLLRVFPLIKNL